ncbi:uncharacterized protein LOC106753750 isoform X3 [Vigna radiata var. radiata]|uniref:Uncharacterized protein LOC106753750 isoform X3 n=1 Tax=Vigna radiata var. radiata TaxID=3916 RepID=A0A3Q0ET19_VIGRR|nr:uncharacterized protein LOC106753750 isoform X3 [Vigna radiata var. radiata]
MELLSFALGGVGFILVGAHEALIHVSPSKQSPISSPPNSQTNKLLLPISLAILSSFFILNSTVSLLSAHNSNDAVGTALQLQVLPIAFIFLFYSLLPLFSLPSPLHGLVGLFAFAEEFLLFYLQRKDPSGVENRYYDLLLVPIAICLFCTLLDVGSPRSTVPKLGRGVGLILHGTWLLQMGLSLFSGWVAQGCSLHRVSRGNYTLRCKGHPEYHRARAIATLQFNCHLAFLVVVLVGFFSLVCARNGGSTDLDSVSTRYAPLGAELQNMQDSTNFTLDSDEDDDSGRQEGHNVGNEKGVAMEHAVNGNGIKDYRRTFHRVEQGGSKAWKEASPF